MPMQSPFVEQYKKENFELYFLSAHHEVSEDSQTFKLIKSLFKNKRFEVVILEGFQKSKGISPPDMIKYSKEKGVSEDSYAIRLATDVNIPFTGGEPLETEVAQSVLKAGYSPQDLLGFYFVRQIPSFKREGRFKKETVEQAYGKFMPWQKTSAGFKDFQFFFDDFKAWYKKINKKEFSLDTFDTEEPAPHENGIFLTQRISSVVDRTRNVYVVKTIADQLNTYKKVLVIYGSSHLESLRPVLVQMLGQPIARFANANDL